MTHQIDILSPQKCSCLSRYVRARIVVVKSDPSSPGGFADFLEGNWETNGCISLRIDCSALFYWYDCDMTSFFEKNMRSFAWKCFVREQLLLDLTHLETPILSGSYA